MQIKIKGTPEEIKKLYKHMTNDLAAKEIMKEPISPYHFRSLDVKK